MYTTRFFFRARIISLTRACRVVHLEHPVHASNSKGCSGSGYLERHLGVNRSTVTRAVQAGRIAPDADGRFDFNACATAWHASAGGRTDVAARHAEKRGADIPQAHPSPKNAARAHAAAALPALDDTTDAQHGNTSTRNKAKTLVLHYENSSIKLEMALRRFVRVIPQDAGREAAGLGSLLRAGIERVIDQTAPRLAAAGNELQRRQILDKELKHLRWMFKRELPRAVRRLQEQGAGKKAEAES